MIFSVAPPALGPLFVQVSNGATEEPFNVIFSTVITTAEQNQEILPPKMLLRLKLMCAEETWRQTRLPFPAARGEALA